METSGTNPSRTDGSSSSFLPDPSSRVPKQWFVAAFGQEGCADRVCGAAWKTFLSDPIRSAMTIDNGRIFAVGVYGDVYALDASTGKLLDRPRTDVHRGPQQCQRRALRSNTGYELQAFQESGCSAVCKPLAVINDPVQAHGVAIFPPVIANGARAGTPTATASER